MNNISNIIKWFLTLVTSLYAVVLVRHLFNFRLSKIEFFLIGPIDKESLFYQKNKKELNQVLTRLYATNLLFFFSFVACFWIKNSQISMFIAAFSIVTYFFTMYFERQYKKILKKNRG